MDLKLWSSIRPTGPLHLGHYVGMLESWVALRRPGFMVLADYAALHAGRRRHLDIRGAVFNAAVEVLAAGLEPAHVALVVQSCLPEQLELHALLVPEAQSTAEILLLRPHFIVGGTRRIEDVTQATRFAQKYNQTFGTVMSEPRLLLGRVPSLTGLDGKQRMSRTLGNAISLTDDPETVRRKVRRLFTDSGRRHASDPGKVDGNQVFSYHEAFNPNAGEVRDLKEAYRRGQISDMAVKSRLAEHINELLAPMQERRREYLSRPELVHRLLREGTAAARHTAQETLCLVKRNLGLLYA